MKIVSLISVLILPRTIFARSGYFADAYGDYEGYNSVEGGLLIIGMIILIGGGSMILDYINKNREEGRGTNDTEGE